MLLSCLSHSSHRSLLLSAASAAAAAGGGGGGERRSVLGGAARSDLELELLKPPAPGRPRPAAPSWLEAVQCRPGAAPEGRAIGGTVTK